MYRVAQFLRQQIGEVRAAHRPGQEGVAVAVNKVREITRPVRIRRHADLARVDALRLPRALIVGKEEQLVAADRPAQCPAKLVLPVRSARRRKVVPRIEIGVAQKIECAAVESVVAGFCNHADLPAAELPILGVEVARHNAKLGNRIQVGNDRRARIHILFRVAAVHAEVVCGLPLPVDGNRAGIQRARWIENRRAHILHSARPDRGRWSHARLQREKIGEAAPIQRHRRHLASADHFAQLRAHSFHVQTCCRSRSLSACRRPLRALHRASAPHRYRARCPCAGKFEIRMPALPAHNGPPAEPVRCNSPLRWSASVVKCPC